MSKDVTPVKMFLIGMMGSGKSHWAKRLAKKLKVTAYDLDYLVELMEERSIAEIFEQSGEEYFRKEESKMLKLFRQKKAFIVSCGGGTPCFYDNMEWMNKNGITIWLDEPIEVLSERLLTEKDHRPLISKLAPHELTAFLQSKRDERKPFYSQAQHHLSGVHITESNILKLLK